MFASNKSDVTIRANTANGYVNVLETSLFNYKLVVYLISRLQHIWVEDIVHDIIYDVIMCCFSITMSDRHQGC